MEPRRYPALTLYRWLLGLARPYWLHMAGVFVLGLVATPLALLAPLPLKIVVDSAIGGRPLPAALAPFVPISLAHSFSGAVFAAVMLLLAVALLNQLQGLASWVLQAYTGERLLLSVRSQLFAHVQRLSLRYHDTRGTADSTYRIHYDAMSVQNMAVNGVVPFVTSTMTLVVMLIATARLDWQIATVPVLLIPVLFLLVRSSRGRVYEQWSAVKEAESSAMSVVQEVLGSLRVVKAFGQEEREHGRFLVWSHRTLKGQVALARTQGTFDAAVGMLIAAGMAAVLSLGAVHVRSGAISLGVLVVLMAYTVQLLAPIESITKKASALRGAFTSAARAFELLDQAPDVEERRNSRPLARASGAVSCRGVCFEYEQRHPVLHDITLDIAPGSRVGIAGRTGAGKTTLINLLIRFYDPTAGAILLDGVDLRDYKLADLRRQFGIVLQEPVLFSSSLAENIAYARPDASRDDIIAAARAAGAHEFISALPEGYNTPVGERGLKLSGGERQRVSLARAFLKDAPILILDEPTSSVDVQTESLIMDAMERLMRGRTTFMIAHRLSTLEHCDVRIVLDAGRIASVTPNALAIA